MRWLLGAVNKKLFYPPRKLLGQFSLCDVVQGCGDWNSIISATMSGATWGQNPPTEDCRAERSTEI